MGVYTPQLQLTYEPCERKYTWVNLTASNSPPSRYGANSITVDGVIYVYGGYSQRLLTDLWAYVVSENAWKQLTPVTYPTPTFTGSSMLLSPWKVLIYGGDSFDSNLYIYNPILKQYVKVETTGVNGFPKPHLHRDLTASSPEGMIFPSNSAPTPRASS